MFCPVQSKMSSSLPSSKPPRGSALPGTKPAQLTLHRLRGPTAGIPEAEPGHTPSPGPAPRRERSCGQAASQAYTYTNASVRGPGRAHPGRWSRALRPRPSPQHVAPHFRPGQAFSGCLLPVCCRLCVRFLGRPRPRPGVSAPLTRAP